MKRIFAAAGLICAAVSCSDSHVVDETAAEAELASVAVPTNTEGGCDVTQTGNPSASGCVRYKLRVSWPGGTLPDEVRLGRAEVSIEAGSAVRQYTLAELVSGVLELPSVPVGEAATAVVQALAADGVAVLQARWSTPEARAGEVASVTPQAVGAPEADMDSQDAGTDAGRPRGPGSAPCTLCTIGAVADCEDDPATPGNDCPTIVACGMPSMPMADEPVACDLGASLCCVDDMLTQTYCTEDVSCMEDSQQGHCDGPEDCGFGGACCLSSSAVPTCEADCGGGFTICHQDSDCPVGLDCTTGLPGMIVPYWGFCD